MRPQGLKPRFGGPGQHRPNSSNQTSPRPQFPGAPFPKSPQGRGNGNPNWHRRGPGPFGPAVGPNVPMMRPPRPMMGPNGSMMGPYRPMMRPFGPMMGPNAPPPPPGFLMTRPPNQPPIKSEVVSGMGGKNNENKNNIWSNTSGDEGSSNYNYPRFETGTEMNCNWPGSTYASAWNLSSPFCQSYYQNYDQGYNEQYSENYDQYWNQGQPFMPDNYFNVKEEGTNHKPNFNQNGGPGNTPKNRKKNEKFQKLRTHYCDTCDRSFPSEGDLSTHISEHVVCGLDDCKYTANPRVVEKHQQMQHHSGLYRRIGSLYTPEDIEKWRKERKKNYPTPQNVEERRAKQEEMYARGERMGMQHNRGPRNKNNQRNGRFQQARNARANNPNCGNPGLQQPPPNPTAEAPQKWRLVFPPVTMVIEENEQRNGVKPFLGTAALYPKDPMPISESDGGKPQEPIPTRGSLSFLSQYGDSSSEEDSVTEETVNDSSVASERVEKDCANTLMGVVAVENAGNTLQAEPKFSDNPPEGAPLLSNSSEGPVFTSSYSEKRNEDESLSMKASTGVTSPIAESSAPKEEEKVSAASNEGKSDLSNSLDSGNSSSLVGSPQTKSPSKESQPAGETESSSTTANTSTVSPDETLERQNKMNDEMVDGKDDSDDSGPEEVPVVKGTSEDEEGGIEETDEVASGGVKRKRKRQARQPKKKTKVEEEKQVDQSDQQQQPQMKNPRRFDNNRKPHPLPVRREPTLLEKLLNKEICHERNVILQCVRYVVENNYFRKDGPKYLQNGTL